MKMKNWYFKYQLFDGNFIHWRDRVANVKLNEGNAERAVKARSFDAILLQFLLVIDSGRTDCSCSFWRTRGSAELTVPNENGKRRRAFLKFSCDRSCDRQADMGLALNAITYQSSETRCGEAVRCILINNGEAIRAATFVRHFRGCTINCGAGTEITGGSTVSEENRVPSWSCYSICLINANLHPARDVFPH